MIATLEYRGTKIHRHMVTLARKPHSNTQNGLTRRGFRNMASILKTPRTTVLTYIRRPARTHICHVVATSQGLPRDLRRMGVIPAGRPNAHCLLIERAQSSALPSPSPSS